MSSIIIITEINVQNYKNFSAYKCIPLNVQYFNQFDKKKNEFKILVSLIAFISLTNFQVTFSFIPPDLRENFFFISPYGLHKILSYIYVVGLYNRANTYSIFAIAQNPL